MKIFAAQVEEGKEGKDGKPSVGPVYRNLLASNGFPSVDSDLNTAWDIFSMSVQKYPGNRMLGWRPFVDGKFGPYVWKTYKEVYEEVLQIVSALRASGAEPGCRVGIYGANCPQWVEAMEACNALSLICVPLYDTLGPGAVNFILDHAEIDFVFVQDKKVKELLSPDCRSAQRLRVMVCFTSLTAEQKEMAVQTGIKPYSWDEFLHLGKVNEMEILPPQPFNICTIMYTSGTSGDPKGVVLTHETIATFVSGVDLFLDQFEDKMTVDDVYLSFLPLAHILDRVIEEYFFRRGASVGYYHGDLNALRDDLMELKPTLLAGVPRVFEKIHEGRETFLGIGIKKALEELRPLRRRIFDALYKYKLAWMNMGYKQREASPLADLLAFRKVKARLGGRLRLVISGGAPLSTEVEEFLRVTCCAFLVQGYGLTETCGPTTVCFPDEMCMVGTAGPVSVYSELRLEEVPEMGYSPLDDPPCGEIWVYGDSLKSMLVAVVVPCEEDTKKWAYSNGHAGSFLELCSLVQLQNYILSELKNAAERNKVIFANWDTGCFSLLRGFEHIKGVILDPRPFDMERDLVTATLKKKRNKLLIYYQVTKITLCSPISIATIGDLTDNLTDNPTIVYRWKLINYMKNWPRDDADEI
ncbi:Long chain acyl-CoA synthetase 1 [Citrus sinensis]|uniref:Long chain acyl-CoA synthetase 1 n=1 Tax=Citrus sinensis TaxID=2711 RepID=A0ACB8MMN6_CITSI|nr:Long chain acyl-CoA synthetase 1 [Citrus sinensis]